MSLGKPLQVVEAGAELSNKGSFEDARLLDFAGAIGGELYDFDPGTSEPALRFVGEEQQRDVPRYLVFIHGNREPHPPIHFGRVGHIQQTTAHVVKMLANHLDSQVLHACL